LSQNDELARVKARIKALTDRTVARGCTEAEAMAAAEMAGRLLERYALTMSEIDVRQEPCVQVEVPLGGTRRRPIDACVPAIARFCDCKVWLARDPVQSNYIFFGFETDAGLAAYLFSVIDRAIRTELARFRDSGTTLGGTALRRAIGSFQHGMAARVAERLEAMHEQRESAARRASASTSTARWAVATRPSCGDGTGFAAQPGLCLGRSGGGAQGPQPDRLRRRAGHDRRHLG
jgi:hypothetical protein